MPGHSKECSSFAGTSDCDAEQTATKLTFLKHHRHHLGWVQCHGNDPYSSVASTRQLGKHVAACTHTIHLMLLTHTV